MANKPGSRPNIILILLDDIGFADTSTFGGLAKTPQLDALAARGLRYINFNTTGLCSPTRAALLSGRNHHRVGFGGLPEFPSHHPGYHCIWNRAALPFSEALRRNGYATAAFGKWHNTPYWELNPLGPFDRWPTRLGFDYFYGFVSGSENQWEPSGLYQNTTPINAEATAEAAYHVTTDIVDDALRWLRVHEAFAGDRPYFLYLAPGAVHSPHHAPREWIDKYRGVFDQGWDLLNEAIFARQKELCVVPPCTELTPRPDVVPPWRALSRSQKRLYARQMEVYAGFVSHTDHEIGRLLRGVHQSPHYDNTLIMYIVGDNGASGVGGLDGSCDGCFCVDEQLNRFDELGGSTVAHNIYSAGWAWLGSTPFRWWKTVASHFGGVRNPLIVSWPSKLEGNGDIRAQFAHVTDVAPTIYEVTGVPSPHEIEGVRQLPLDGVSFAHTFYSREAPSHHVTQYFEIIGNRAIYHQGWIAAAPHRVAHWANATSSDYSHDIWELYQVDRDFSQSHDLAAEHPQKLTELRDLFESEARTNSVFPFGAWLNEHREEHSDQRLESRRDFVFYPGVPRIHTRAMPSLAGRSFRVEAEVDIPEKGAEGVLLSYGSRSGGFVLYVLRKRLIFENNVLDRRHETIGSDGQLDPGVSNLMFEFILKRKASPGADQREGDLGSGVGRLYVNGLIVGQAEISGVITSYSLYGALGIGKAFGSPVSNGFRPPFAFTGILLRVNLHLDQPDSVVS